MQDSLATAPRNILAIKRRQVTDLGVRGFRKLAKLTSGRPDEVSSALLYPTVRSQVTLEDLVNRLAWYLPAAAVSEHQLYLPIGPQIEAAIPAGSPDSQPTYDRDHLDVTFVSPERVGSVAADVDRLLCHDFYGALDATLLRNLARVEIVDPMYYLSRSCQLWPRETRAFRENIPDYSRENFRRLSERAADYEDSFVFATGPSLTRAYDFEFPDDSLSVVCNSIVRNEELLDHIGPDVLVFADPVFHFGPSRYAHEFREDAARTIRDDDCMAVLPEYQRSLLVGHYPDLADRVVGIEPVQSDLPRFPTHHSLDVMATANIMTLFMLPIASSLTDRVHVIGADGREEDSSYFWEHSDEAQYDDDLMQTAVDSHPSFFRDRVYTDYYDEHVEILTEMIEYGERQGINYVSLTDSYIPCLQNRFSPEGIA